MRSISRSRSRASAARRRSGAPHVVRLKVPDGRTVAFHDLIRGDIAYASAELDDLVFRDGFELPLP